MERVGKTKTTALQQNQLIIYIPYVYEQRATTTTRAIVKCRWKQQMNAAKVKCRKISRFHPLSGKENRISAQKPEEEKTCEVKLKRENYALHKSS